MSGVRSTARWQRVRAQVLREERDCWRCHRPLDFDAPPRSKLAPSVDHVKPLAHGGDPFDRANLRAAHYGCNASMGAKLKRAARAHKPSELPARTREVMVPVCARNACVCNWTGFDPARCDRLATRKWIPCTVPAGEAA